MPRRVPREELLSRYVTTATGCWEWIGSRNQYGYGRANVEIDGRRRLLGVHRLAYEWHCGPIPSGMVVMHICDNRACINPTHLRVGTAADNNADCRAKGRAVPPPPGGPNALPDWEPPPPPVEPPPGVTGVKAKLWRERFR